MRRNNEHPSAASRHLPQGGENPHPLSKILLELSEFLPPWGECPPAGGQGGPEIEETC